MADISFYHLHSLPLGKALPKLLEKVYASGAKAIVSAPSEDNIEQLNKELWTYTTKFFLPHGSKKDGFVEKQPIYLTAANENPNGATIFVATGGKEIDFDDSYFSSFNRFLDMFDGTDEKALQQARKRWTSYKKAGHNLRYWKQNSKGGWEEGA